MTVSTSCVWDPTQTYPGLLAQAGNVTLRQPDAAAVHTLARAVAGGLHLPDHLQYALWPWYDDSDRCGSARRMSRDMYAAWDLSAPNPHLPFAIVVDGAVVGCQALQVVHGPYRYSRELQTSSWLIPGARGAGIGYAARQAVLQVAFRGLGAETVRSEAHVGNEASQAISVKCGYRTDGTLVRAENGRRVDLQRFVVDSDSWREPHDLTVTLSGQESFAVDLEIQAEFGGLP